MSRQRVRVAYNNTPTMVIHVRDQYTFGKFLFDCFMTVITSGLWLIWVVIRAVR